MMCVSFEGEDGKVCNRRSAAGGWPRGGWAKDAPIRTFAVAELVMAGSVGRYTPNASSNAFASFRSGVSKPSANRL